MAFRRPFRKAATIVAAVAPLLILTACSSTDDDTKTEPVVVTDQWIKAAPETEHMTAAFATITNPNDQEVRIVSASSDVAGTTELHEVVKDGASSTMQEKQDGFALPAGGTLELTPGGEHIMLMDLKQPIKSGETVTITLRMADGSTQDVQALARDFAGNQEDYQP